MKLIRKTALAGMVLMLVLFTPSVFSANEDQQAEIEQLIHQFVEAFNSSDPDTMAAFYRQSASTDFNERRTEQEDRALHQQILEMLGNLTLQELEIQDSENAKLTVLTSVTGSVNQFRFKLVGKPAKIDGFSVGMPPTEEEEELYTDHQADVEHAMPDDAAQHGPFGFLTSAKGVYQSQILLQSDGSLLLVWVQKGLYDLDLFVARQQQDGEFSHPLRINQRGLNRYTGDEARPSVALGPDGAVAVAWTAANQDIMIAVGSNYATQFDAPLKLNQDDSRAFRTMPSVSFSPDGAAHAVWLDPRQAPEGMEEPSDLYYAIVKNGSVTETNLTARQEPTVCGCCRPYIAIDEEGVFDILFRNEDSNGYRDISRISGTSGTLGEPQPTSPPIWKLNACPSAGPIASQGGTLWKDASTGDWRMLWSTDAETAPSELFSDRDDLDLIRSPRKVSGRDNWVLIGAQPHSMIATLVDDSWKIIHDNLPPWASSATVKDDKLILMGNRRGLLLTSIQPL